MFRFAYFSEKAVFAMRRAPGVSLLSATTISAALLLMGISVMALQNLERLALVWGRAGNISCYLEAPKEKWESIQHTLEQLPGVERTVLVTPAQALKRFRARGVEAAALVEGVNEDILPAAVELYLAGGFTDLAAVGRLGEAASKVVGVGDIDFGADEFARLQELVRALRYAGTLLGALLAVGTALMVCNTIRLTVYARRDEISILRLVGATGWFIRWPFVIEGVLWGAVGGLLSGAALYGCDKYLSPRLTHALAGITGGLDVRLFATRVAAGLVVGGIALGGVGSMLAVRRFLDVEAA